MCMGIKYKPIDNDMSDNLRFRVIQEVKTDYIDSWTTIASFHIKEERDAYLEMKKKENEKWKKQ